MKDARLRYRLDQEYVEALGRALYCFAICEWNVLWCAEKIQPGALRAALAKELTAGQIAKRFENVTRNMPPSKDRERLQGLAAQFVDLVGLRNEIVHGKPCTGPTRSARLSNNKVLEVGDINDAADAFSQCSIHLNSELYGFLAKQKPVVDVGKVERHDRPG